MAENRPELLARVTDWGAAREMAFRLVVTQRSVSRIRARARYGVAEAAYDALPVASSNSRRRSTWLPVRTDCRVAPWVRMASALSQTSCPSWGSSAGGGCSADASSGVGVTAVAASRVVSRSHGTSSPVKKLGRSWWFSSVGSSTTRGSWSSRTRSAASARIR